MDSDRDSNGKGAIKKRKIRKFQSSWLDETAFKGWLAPYHQENKAICTACNKTIRCCKTDLIKHSQTVKHIENFQEIDNNDEELPEMSIKDQVKRGLTKLGAFFAEHNIAFDIADHLIPLLKDICKNPKVVQEYSAGRLKCTNIVKNVIAKREVEKIVDNLQSSKFSILIDESTDISDTKLMCVLVRYVSPLSKKVVTQLLELVSLDAKDCSASKLFEAFKKLLKEKNIPIKNIVGLASDNASVMTGCNNSFMQLLKLEAPRLVMLRCICHSSAIVASKACAKLPSSCEQLIRNISTYISGSAKRSANLREFQTFFNVESNKLLKLSNTRWLILHKCVVRILENWEVLKHYFKVEVFEDKSKSAEIILSQLDDNTIKAYFLFLKYVLNFFNNFNALFQSRKILLHKLLETSQQLIRELAQNFMTVNSLKDISNLNVDDEQNILHLENVYVGPECENFLESLSLECRHQMKLACLAFYKTAVQEMLKRLPYKDPLFEHLTFLEPQTALYDENRIKIKDLTHIAMIVEDIDITKLNVEWTMLPRIFNDEQKKELACLDIDDMWGKIVEYKDSNEEKIFPNLKLLVEVVLCFPHSNAEAERIFSIVTDVKNKKRNRLSNDTVSAICIVRSSFQAQGINCINFEPDPRHLELHNSQNLYGHTNTSDEK